jgi:Ran-binding protein 1
MSDVAKPDPAADQVANPAATLVKDETAKVTADIAANKSETTETKDDKPITEKATEAASSAAAAVKDNVFSMFGGGPAKVKKEEVDDADEPSGATKKPETVRLSDCTDVACLTICRRRTPRARSPTSTSSP